jgi:hypothetical protein
MFKHRIFTEGVCLYVLTLTDRYAASRQEVPYLLLEVHILHLPFASPVFTISGECDTAANDSNFLI